MGERGGILPKGCWKKLSSLGMNILIRALSIMWRPGCLFSPFTSMQISGCQATTEKAGPPGQLRPSIPLERFILRGRALPSEHPSISQQPRSSAPPPREDARSTSRSGRMTCSSQPLAGKADVTVRGEHLPSGVTAAERGPEGTVQDACSFSPPWQPGRSLKKLALCLASRSLAKEGKGKRQTW